MKISEPVPIAHTKIIAVNADLGERLNREGVHMTWDEDGDTLLVDIGGPSLGMEKPGIDGISIRIHPSTYKIIGCTILAFQSDFLGKNKLIRKAFPQAIESFKAADGAIELKGQQAEQIKPFFEFILSH